MTAGSVADAPPTDRSWLAYVAMATAVVAVVVPFVVPLPFILASVALTARPRGAARGAAWGAIGLGVVALVLWALVTVAWSSAMSGMD
ncbi:hypothetical protein [Demequina litorisediminis]|uniref:DUF4190 domain-containing protein n=1 Tax=Demequina litorisediminis TaxID=1849022 RepID=A0ABQ6IG69_9MICO|nr:hypothetical protein [Demequina litorisediminis]GMA36863.1 hypothetical protein GCM10025876_30670 [Demequina litorisediminis]